jgi:hypothetical protein
MKINLRHGARPVSLPANHLEVLEAVLMACLDGVGACASK